MSKIPAIIGGGLFAIVIGALLIGNPVLATKIMIVANIIRYFGGLTFAFVAVIDLLVRGHTMGQVVKLIGIGAISGGAAVIPEYDFPYAFSVLWK